MNEHKHLKIEIVWISDHTEIEGNQYTDVKAKKTVKDLILNQAHNYKSPKSIRIRYIKIIIKKQWLIIWNGITKTMNSYDELWKKNI